MFALDTHVHTCLSPCGELEMHPTALTEAALLAGLDAVAVCDHNSAENVAAVERAGRGVGLTILPGMEITSSEEVHVLALLPNLEAAMALQSKIYNSLPGRNDDRIFGLQVIANEHAEVLGFNEHLLAGATTLAVEEVVEAIHRVNGLAVASHVDRERFGIIGQLGFIPPNLKLDALEISANMDLSAGRVLLNMKGDVPLLCASDAHQPEDVGRGMTFMRLEHPTLAEIRQALRDENGRAVLGGGRPMEDLALHILDIAHNSLEAGATIVDIRLAEEPEADRMIIELRDNGKGMDPETLAKALDPFFTTRGTRRVGLGLPLLAQASRMAGGSIAVESVPGRGTTVRATFQNSHIDRAPLGDIETSLMVLLIGHPEVNIRYQHRVGDRSFDISTEDLRLALEDISLTSPEGLKFVREVLRAGEAALTEAGRGIQRAQE